MSRLVREIFVTSAVVRKLENKAAVVRERIVHGGGTRWYYCRDLSALQAVDGVLSSSSLVTFYFDDMIERHGLRSRPPLLVSTLMDLLKDYREVAAGLLAGDGVTINMSDPSSSWEIDEFVDGLTYPCELFYGTFGPRDGAVVDAVTVTIPDADGVVRNHSY